MAFPAFVDMHTHLDKGHVWPRAANPDGTFMGAVTTVHEAHPHLAAGATLLASMVASDAIPRSTTSSAWRR